MEEEIPKRGVIISKPTAARRQKAEPSRSTDSQSTIDRTIIAAISLAVCGYAAISVIRNSSYDEEEWFLEPLSQEMDDDQAFEELRKAYVELSGGEFLEAVEAAFEQVERPHRSLVKPERRKTVPKISSFERTVHHVFRIIRGTAAKGVNAPHLADIIVRESVKRSYDPLFVAAVIKSESTFDRFAKSPVGAMGLMQIMPKTAAYIANTNASGPVIQSRLSDPEYNVQLGIDYLKYLESLYRGNKVLTLIAYNWGPGRVEKAIQGNTSVPSSVIAYAKKVLEDHRRWRHEISFSQ